MEEENKKSSKKVGIIIGVIVVILLVAAVVAWLVISNMDKNTPEEVLKDQEGIQTMQVLGKNMAWILKCIENGKKLGIHPPSLPTKIKTNYIQ